MQLGQAYIPLRRLRHENAQRQGNKGNHWLLLSVRFCWGRSCSREVVWIIWCERSLNVCLLPKLSSQRQTKHAETMSYSFCTGTYYVQKLGKHHIILNSHWQGAAGTSCPDKRLGKTICNSKWEYARPRCSRMLKVSPECICEWHEHNSPDNWERGDGIPLWSSLSTI